MIALWRDDDGFDVLMNWGETDQHSLRADGAQIIGAAPSSELVHLMVAHGDGGLEHFLFSLDEDGSGELLRSRGPDVPGGSTFELRQRRLRETTLRSPHVSNPLRLRVLPRKIFSDRD